VESKTLVGHQGAHRRFQADGLWDDTKQPSGRTQVEVSFRRQCAHAAAVDMGELELNCAAVEVDPEEAEASLCVGGAIIRLKASPSNPPEP